MGAGYMGPGFGLRYPTMKVGSDEDFANDYVKEDVSPIPQQSVYPDSNYQLVSKAVKVATPETYELYPTSQSAIAAAQMFLEPLSGNELIEVSRHDLINGASTKYQPIKDAQIIATQFNAFNIIPLQDTLPNYLDNFPIKLEEKLPNIAAGESNVTIDANGIITIELINIKPDEAVEVEILYQGEILNDTIYGQGESS